MLSRCTLLTVVLVLASVVACTTEPGSPPDASPTGTARPAAPTAPTVATATPAPSGSPTHVGTLHSRVDDPTGDLLDPEGNAPPGGGAAADLTAVELERGTDGVLEVVLHVAGPIPQRADSLLWSVQLDGRQRYTVAAQLTGGELSAGVYDHRLEVQHALPGAEVTGSTVRLRVSNDELDGLGPDLRWRALTQLDGAYEDRTDPTQVTG